MQLQDSVIIITGGGQGLGRAMGEFLAAKGARLALVDLNQEALDAAVAACKQAGGDARSYICNVANEEQVSHMVNQVADDFGAIHGLINNAGGQYPSPVASINQKGFETVVRTNLVGGFLMAREVYNQHMAKHGGAMVNMLADMWKGMPGMGHSGAARAGPPAHRPPGCRPPPCS